MRSKDPAGGPLASSVSDGDVHLLDYWRVLVRRRLAIAITSIAVLAATLAFTLLQTPAYRATTTLEISRQGPDILSFKDVLGADPSYASYQDFYQTQYRILQSESVLEIAAQRMDLANRPEYAGRRGSPIQRVRKQVSSWFEDSKPEADPGAHAARFIAESLEIRPIRGSHLVEITFMDRSPVLAADVADAVADAYQQFQFAARYDTTGKAKEFLARDVGQYQTEIAELERQLQQYGADKEILSLSDGTQDISEKALADINSRYTEARVRLAEAEAKHTAIEDADPEALPEVLRSPVIIELRQQVGSLERRKSQLSERFHDRWPPLLQLTEELRQARRQLADEAEQIAHQVRAVARTDHDQARAELDEIQAERERQTAEFRRVNGDAVEYGRLKTEIVSKREVLASLVGRQYQTESSYRLKDSSTSNVRVVDAAKTPTKAARPRKLLNLGLALVAGLFLGVIMAFVLDHLDNSVKHEQDVTRITGLPAMGYVPLARSLRTTEEGPGTAVAAPLASNLDLAAFGDPRSAFSESFRNLRTSLLLSAADHPPRTVAITSCEPSDGKSTVAMNLAIVLTQLDRRVLLIDADLRRPRVHKTLGCSNDAGLSNYLSGNAGLDSLIHTTDIPGLSVMTSGPIPPNPSELLTSPRMQAMLEAFIENDRFDHVIADSPPVQSVTDAAIISSKVDATVLVVRAGVTSRQVLAQSVERLRQTRGHIVGTVLNAVSRQTDYYYGRNSRYSRYYVENGEESRRRVS